jgi:hypothetical protein
MDIGTPPGTGTDGGTGGSGAVPDGGGAILSVTREDGNAVSSEVTRAGATLTATGSDGTKYELVVPANAVDETTTITLTPAAASGTIFGEDRKSRLGVQFAPQGLFLWERATLTIAPAKGADIPLAEQLFVRWEDGGKDFGLAPVDPESKEMRVFVDHFSGVSIFDVKGVDAKLSMLDQWIADKEDEHFHSRVAEAMALKREDSSLYGVVHDQLVGDLGQEYIDTVLEPRIAEAWSSCARAKLAMISAIEFSRALGMLGEDDLAIAWKQKAMAIFPTRANVCMKEEYEICRDEHVLDRIMAARVTVDAQRQQWGLELSAAESEKLDEYVRGCMTFKVVLDGFGGFQVDGVYKMEHKVSADGVSVQLDGSYVDWLGGATWKIGPAVPMKTVTYAPVSLDSCIHVTNISPQDSTFTVTDFNMISTVRMGIKDFMVKYTMTPNTSSFDLTIQGHDKAGACAGDSVTSPQSSVNWFLTHIMITAQKNPGDSQHNYTLTKWSTDPNGEDVGVYVFAYSMPQNSGLVYDNDVFKVRHEPAVVADLPPN